MVEKLGDTSNLSKMRGIERLKGANRYGLGGGWGVLLGFEQNKS